MLLLLSVKLILCLPKIGEIIVNYLIFVKFFLFFLCLLHMVNVLEIKILGDWKFSQRAFEKITL